MKHIESIKTEKKTQAEISLEAERLVWQQQYDALLKRKNKKAEALLSAGKTLESSPKYQSLKVRVNEVWEKLNKTKPEYKPLTK